MTLLEKINDWLKKFDHPTVREEGLFAILIEHIEELERRLEQLEAGK